MSFRALSVCVCVGGMEVLLPRIPACQRLRDKLTARNMCPLPNECANNEEVEGVPSAALLQDLPTPTPLAPFTSRSPQEHINKTHNIDFNWSRRSIRECEWESKRERG